MKKLMFLILGVMLALPACKHKKNAEKHKTEAVRTQTSVKKTVTATKTPKPFITNRYPKRPVVLHGMANLGLSKQDRLVMEMLGSAAKGHKALGAILAMGDDGNRLLKKALRWTNPNGRTQAAIIASKIKHPDTEVLALMTQNLLRDPDPDCRAQIAATFVNIRYRPACLSLLKMLENDPHPMARANAAWALGAMRYQRAVLSLISALNNKATWVRLRAASALKKLANPKAIKALRTHIKIEKNVLVKKRLKQALAACMRHR